ncbi:MAG TPA: GNAT family N-acetyltransferase [Pirellulales bacterium]|nr:GNAT family N-acetyltransferase [Pirellulales bacterium]
MITANSSALQRLVQTGRYYGPSASARWLGLRIAEKLLRVEVSQLLYLDAIKLPPSIDTDPEFTFRFLEPAEVAHFVQDQSHNLVNDFIARSASRNDLCLAILHGDRLVSYSWYARNSIEGQHHVGVPMSYPANTIYMYNAFTHPDYRGRRLYGMGIALALKELSQQGVTKLITSVNSYNFASLRSCRRMGFEDLGRIWTLGRGARRLALTPLAARRIGISFGCQTQLL